MSGAEHGAMIVTVARVWTDGSVVWVPCTWNWRLSDGPLCGSAEVRAGAWRVAYAGCVG